jgi:RNA polymerase-interacting CarD/CdnL/TRCF family regulator
MPDHAREYRRYLELVKTGDVFLVGQVFLDLRWHATRRSLSFGERKLFGQARRVLLQRLQLAATTSDEEIARRLGPAQDA